VLKMTKIDLVLVLFLMAILIPSVSAETYATTYDQTTIEIIESTTLNNITFANQTADIVDQNGTIMYRIISPPSVVKSVPLGLDIQIQLQIVQTFAIVVIMFLMVIRSVYSLALWLKTRGV